MRPLPSSIGWIARAINATKFGNACDRSVIAIHPPEAHPNHPNAIRSRRHCHVHIAKGSDDANPRAVRDTLNRHNRETRIREIGKGELFSLQFFRSVPRRPQSAPFSQTYTTKVPYVEPTKPAKVFESTVIGSQEPPRCNFNSNK